MTTHQKAAVPVVKPKLNIKAFIEAKKTTSVLEASKAKRKLSYFCPRQKGPPQSP